MQMQTDEYVEKTLHDLMKQSNKKIIDLTPIFESSPERILKLGNYIEIHCDRVMILRNTQKLRESLPPFLRNCLQFNLNHHKSRQFIVWRGGKEFNAPTDKNFEIQIQAAKVAFFDMECAICYEPLVEQNGYVLKCQHAYHADCFHNWVYSQTDLAEEDKNDDVTITCPECRAPVMKVNSDGVVAC